MEYSDLIDNESSSAYTKRRKALLDFTCGDVVKTTQILDIFAEIILLSGYKQ